MMLPTKLIGSPAERSSRALMLFMMRASSEGRLAVSAHRKNLEPSWQQLKDLSLDSHETGLTAF